MPRMPVRRLGFVWTPGGCQGGREGEGERGGGEFLWRVKSSEREGEGEVDCLLSSSRTGTYTRNQTLGEIYHEQNDRREKGGNNEIVRHRVNETTPDNLGGLQADETTLGVRLPTRNNLKKSREKSTTSEETAQSPKEME